MSLIKINIVTAYECGCGCGFITDDKELVEEVEISDLELAPGEEYDDEDLERLKVTLCGRLTEDKEEVKRIPIQVYKCSLCELLISSDIEAESHSQREPDSLELGFVYKNPKHYHTIVSACFEDSDQGNIKMHSATHGIVALLLGRGRPNLEVADMLNIYDIRQGLATGNNRVLTAEEFSAVSQRTSFKKLKKEYGLQKLSYLRSEALVLR
jgi:hypothetical protein